MNSKNQEPSQRKVYLPECWFWPLTSDLCSLLTGSHGASCDPAGQCPFFLKYLCFVQLAKHFLPKLKEPVWPGRNQYEPVGSISRKNMLNPEGTSGNSPEDGPAETSCTHMWHQREPESRITISECLVGNIWTFYPIWRLLLLNPKVFFSSEGQCRKPGI